MSTSDRWSRIESLYHAARERDAGEQAAFLESACNGDAELRRDVESLLAQPASSDGFLGAPAVAVAAQMITNPGSSQLTGRLVGAYQIQTLLGAGGMGDVYSARDTRLKRTVAIKVLPHDKVANSDRERRFLQEARAASALNHPNIVTLHDIVHEPGFGIHFLVMEYVPGKSLDRLIPSKGLPLREALGYAQQIAGALTAAHAAGIVHRDIKSANVMVTPEGHVKILDFGLAKLVERDTEDTDAQTRTRPTMLTEPGMVMGTAAYMSPEQATGHELDHRTDIFSLGVVLYEMLAGQRPFRGTSQVATMHAIINDPTPPIAAQPPELHEILEKALAKEPKDRYQHAGDLGLDLRRFQRAWEGKSLLSMRSGGANTPRRPVAWVAAAVVFLLATAANLWISRSAAPAGDSLAAVTITPFTTDPGYEGDPAFSPDGQTIAYVSDRTGRFDIFLRQVGSTSDVALTRDQRDNIQPAFSPDGTQIAFVSSRSGESEISYRSGDLPLVGGDVWVMPALGGAARRIATEGNDPTWSADGSKIVFVYRREKMYEVSAVGGERREIPLRYDVPAGPQIFSPSYSADGRWIFFEAQTGGQGNSIFAVPAAGGAATLLASGWHPAWDAVSQAVVYSNRAEGKNNSLWSLPFSTRDGTISGEPHPLTVGRGRDWQSTVSRDGKRIAFTAMDTTFNLETVPFDAEAGRMLGSPRALTNSTQVIYFMRFSPDGRSVAFQASRGSGTHLWRVDSGADPVQLTADPRFQDTNPQWSPDGTTIAFLRQATSTSPAVGLWLMAADGVNPREMLSGLNSNLPPRWLPDGSGIVYSRQKDRQYYIYDVSTGNSRQVTNEKNVGGQVAVSADGRWLAYQDNVAGKNIDLRAMSLAGGESRVVVATPHADFHPFFSPSGHWLYFQFDHKNIYRVPGPAEDWKPAEPVKITNFPEPAGLFLEDPQISRDGRQLLYSRGKITGDIWILRRGQ
jgi:serine/threonine protein kinase/Tol biopolymer transport system component